MITRRHGSFTSLAVLCCGGTALSATHHAASPSDDAIRAVVSEMLTDSEERSSLLGVNDAASLVSADSAHTLRVGGQMHFRYMATFTDGDDDSTASNTDFETGFSRPGTRLFFDGSAYNDVTYRVSGRFAESGGAFDLEDAFVGYDLGDGWGLYWGQVILPVLWEDVIEETGSLAVDQSVVNTVFRQDRSQALWLQYETNTIRTWFALSDGIRSGNTGYTSEGADWGLTFRGERKLAGAWSAFDDFSSAPDSDYASKLGLAVHWQDGPSAGDIDPSPDVTLGAHTIDAQVEGDGWNMYAAAVHRYTDDDINERNDFGVIAQGGLFFPDSDMEVFGRWDAVFPDSDRAGDDHFNVITAGLNYYIHGQAAKFTADVQVFADDPAGTEPVAAIARGSLGEHIGLLPTTEAGQITFRMQFQLLF